MRHITHRISFDDFPMISIDTETGGLMLKQDGDQIYVPTKLVDDLIQSLQDLQMVIE